MSLCLVRLVKANNNANPNSRRGEIDPYPVGMSSQVSLQRDVDTGRGKVPRPFCKQPTTGVHNITERAGGMWPMLSLQE